VRRRGSQHDGLADEFRVTGDLEIRQHRVANPAAAVDQKGGAPYTDP
jgi:hypothetical protein